MSKKELVLPFDGDFVNVYLNINIWTGQTRLSESDIRLGDGGSLPPAHFASLGSKKLIDPNSLKIFHNLKRKAQSAILAHGIRFLEHYAIPFHKEEEVFKLLEEIESEFIYERNKFVNNLDSSIQSWIDENPEWEMSIRSVQLNPQKIEGRLNFEFLTYRVQATELGLPKLTQNILGLGDKLIREVSLKAQDLYDKSFFGKPYVTSRTLKPLVDMRDKIDGLKFMNTNFMNLTHLLDGAIDAYKNMLNNQLHQPHLGVVTAAILILSDEDKIRNYGQDLSSLAVEADEVSSSEEAQASIEGFFNEAPEAVEVSSSEEVNEVSSNLDDSQNQSNNLSVLNNTENEVESIEEDLDDFLRSHVEVIHIGDEEPKSDPKPAEQSDQAQVQDQEATEVEEQEEITVLPVYDMTQTAIF